MKFCRLTTARLSNCRSPSSSESSGGTYWPIGCSALASVNCQLVMSTRGAPFGFGVTTGVWKSVGSGVWSITAEASTS